MRLLQLLIATTVCLSSCSTKVMKEEIRMVELQNPIIPDILPIRLWCSTMVNFICM